MSRQRVILAGPPAHDPLDLARRRVALEDRERALWRLLDANTTGWRRNDAALRAELMDLESDLAALREARHEQWRADVALNRAAKRREVA